MFCGNYLRIVKDKKITREKQCIIATITRFGNPNKLRHQVYNKRNEATTIITPSILIRFLRSETRSISGIYQNIRNR